MTLAEHLAQHNLDVWKQAGPFVQSVLVRRVRKLPEEQKRLLLPVVLSVLDEALGTEVQGMTSTYNTMTLHRGSVVAGDSLTAVRSEALDILMNLYRSAVSDKERKQIKGALFAATEMPYSTNSGNELLSSVLSDSARVVEFFCEFASGEWYEIIQNVEDKLLWLHRRTIGIQEQEKDLGVLAAARRLSASIQSFRGVADANKGFVIYKTLVGYDSVFPPMWEDEGFDFAKAAVYRQARIDEFVAQVEPANAQEWFAIIQRCARTESNDLATFPSFGQFLQKLGRAKPSILLGYIDRLDDRLAEFLGTMLLGLAESEQPEIVQDKIIKWLSEDRYLVQIAHYYQFAPPTRQRHVTAGPASWGEIEERRRNSAGAVSNLPSLQRRNPGLDRRNHSSRHQLLYR